MFTYALKQISVDTIFKLALVAFVMLTAKLSDLDGLLVPLIGLCAGCEGGPSGSTGDTGDLSTPFLFTWNGKGFAIENDFLFGKPGSAFRTMEEGRRVYESGAIRADLYKINNKIQPVDGRIKFQIKEIEPEESFFNGLTLTRVTYPRTGTLMVHGDFTGYTIFERYSLTTREGVLDQHIEDDRAGILDWLLDYREGSELKNEVHEMYTNDEIRLHGKAIDSERPLYLIMASHYRDWTMGEIFLDRGASVSLSRELQSLFENRLPLYKVATGMVKLSVLTLIMGVAWFYGGIQNFISGGNTDDRLSDTDMLAKSYGAKIAYADIQETKSLVVEYLTDDGYKIKEIVQPRYYQSVYDAIQIPKEAINSDGSVSIRVRATKRHHVSSMFLVSPRKTLKSEETQLVLRKAEHRRELKDYKDTLASNKHGVYLHTIPGDVVDLEFGIPARTTLPSSESISEYLISASGFYTNLSDEGRRKAGDWVSSLDPESHAWLKEMYALKNYHLPNRKGLLDT